jgi:hypothetical protein
MLGLSVLSISVWAQSPTGEVPAATDATTKQTGNTDELKVLRERIAKQEEEIKKLQDSVSEQKTMLDKAMQPTAPASAAAPTPASASTTIPAAPAENGSVEKPARIVPVVNLPTRNVSNSPWNQHPELSPASPLSINIGNTTFTPLGFIDATYFVRSSTIGSGIGTNFGSAPLNNVPNGHLSENNFSAQNSRIGFRVDSDFEGWKVLGYLEADFLFNNNANGFQITSNSAGFRLRNYFVDANNGTFEILGGQDWTMMTPNRKGLSPLPSDIFYTQNMDTNYQNGLVWARQAGFRFIAHPSENVALGVSLENPQQYIGGNEGEGTVTLPSFLGAQSTFAGQFQGNQSLATGGFITQVPNLMPDVIFKAAFDGTPSGKAMHVEFGGVVSGYKDYVPNTSAFTANPYVRTGSHTAFGSGVQVNSNLELFKNFRLIENAFFGDGTGRYIAGLAPDLMIRPDGSIGLIRSASTVDGFEYQVSPKTLLASYYGGTYIGKSVTFDPTATGSSLAKPVYAGYGYTGAPSSQNRDIQEITFDWVQTLWKNRNYGALSLINQYSYLFRQPWYDGTGPKEAHSNMIWIDLRYTLP